ncbi:type III secretion system effector and immunogenic protein OspC2 [Xenorhabdus mauleonii]|uniref:Type III secretion system effector and immunogenic protein OspC2 n=1 Tax=Xenorhabdus mauleonii TaxID=351675 RepID=A0A1I3KW73_9GAMM|nr:hypothetical protein [Xenorhabdus mauleonii]PHM45174.1 type III secretion system effector and immunogenic protein OspC2 [Xenorhabdus mauleonii]SFI76742.1 hypothetical protein SAMN05421680_103211 [Xenorhabdus mauleonii]
MFKKYRQPQSLLNNILTDQEKNDIAGTTFRDRYRHLVATKTNDKMINTGKFWRRKRNLSLPTLSKTNLDELKARLNPLTIEERDFYRRLLGADFYAVHATNSQDVMNRQADLVLFSRKKLIAKNIPFPEENTNRHDIDMIASDDNVFFSLEIGLKPSKNPIDGKGSRFGNTLYKIPFTNSIFDFSSMALLDLLTLETPSCQIGGLSREGLRTLSMRFYLYKRHSLCFYSRKDILNGLALSIIEVARELNAEDQKVILSASSDDEFNDILRGLFRVEIKVPNMVGVVFGQYFRFHYGARR